MATDANGFQIVDSSKPQAQPSAALPTLVPSNTDSNGFQLVNPSGGATPQDESDRFTPSDPNDNWIQSGWKWLAEKPLTESLFGWGRYRQGAGGLERGAEKFLTGMTTPLSVGLLAAFAPAGIVEGVAGNALKEGLTSGAEALGGQAIEGLGAAAKVGEYAKAVDAARKAQIAGQPISAAIETATKGALTYPEYVNYGRYLRDLGLKETDMLSESLARRVAAVGLNKAGLGVQQAQQIAKGAEVLVNAGFGIQQVQGAIYAYPRLADALQEGDYDKAKELLVEAGTGTIFGMLGIAGGLHTLPDIFGSLNETRNLPLSDETEIVKQLGGIRDEMETSALIDASIRARSHLRDMFETAGVPIPAKLKAQAGPLEETISALQEVFQNKEYKQQISDQQKKMFVAMNTGNSRSLSYQTLKALAVAFHQEPWAKQLLEGYEKPERSIEEIQDEQRRSILVARADKEKNQDQLSGLNANIEAMQKEAETSSASRQEELRQALQPLITRRQELELNQDKLDKEYEDVRDWDTADPSTETWFNHYKNLYAQLNEAAKTATNVDEFNEKVRSMSWNPQDLFLIEKRFPQFRNLLMPRKVPIGHTEPLDEIVYLPETGSFKGFRQGKIVERAYIPKEELENYIGPKAADQLLTSQSTPTGSFNVKGDFGYGWYGNEDLDTHDTEEMAPSKQLLQIGPKSNELTSQLKNVVKAQADLRDANARLMNEDTPENRAEVNRLRNIFLAESDKVRGIQNQVGGSVHQLSDGAKLLYATDGSMKVIADILHAEASDLGNVWSSGAVSKIIGSLKANTKYKDIQDKLLPLIEQARNEDDGSLTVMHTVGTENINLRLSVLREELSHAWQYSLNKTFHSHLEEAAYNSLYKQLPKGMATHLENHGYVRKKSMWVIEAAAKMLAMDHTELGITPEEQASWLGKYFDEVNKKYSSKSLEKLTHITEKATRLRDEFLAKIKAENEQVYKDLKNEIDRVEEQQLAGATESSTGGGTVPGLGGTGGTGGSGGPPKPPFEEEYPFQWSDDWRKKFPPSTINGGRTEGFSIAPWQDGAQDKALPANLARMVENAQGKAWKPEDIEYIRSMMQAYAAVAKGLNEKESAFYKTLRDADDQNWIAAYNKELIHSHVFNHIRQIWKNDPNIGHEVSQMAASGAFSTNIIQARHRVFGTALEGLLLGKKLAVHDPVSIIQLDANNIAKAAANKAFIESLRDRGIVDPEGLPMLVINGQGIYVPGENGTNAAVLINPDKVRNIKLLPHEVQRLVKSGLLDTFLKDGRVVDYTPKADQNNVGSWINDSKKRIDTLIHKNPLLPERAKHEVGWSSVQNFARSQATKIGTFLGNVIKQIEEAGPTKDKNYAPIQIPQDVGFAMSPYLRSILNGEARGFITPGDLDRLKKYANRNWQYALGESSFGEKGIRPSEVARLINQEQQFLSPQLKQYLDQNHDLFSTNKDGKVIRTPEGNWTLPGLTTTLKYIHHAATDTEYPKLVKDLSDMNYVNKVLTSVNDITKEEHHAEAEQRLKDINDRQEKNYLWAPKQHVVIDHPSFHAYNWMATAADGTPTLAKSDMAVSRYYYKWMKNRLGLEKSALRQDEGIGKITEPLLRVGEKVKATILSGSPFHIIQEFLRAVMLWVNPFVRPNPIANLDETFNTVRGEKKLLRLGVRNGLTVFADRKNQEDYGVGVSSHIDEDSVLNKIPIANHYVRWANYIHDFLFNRLIPQYKASGFRKMFDKYAKAHPEWSDDAIAKAAAEHVNNAFGGQNWREMGRSATTQDWLHLLTLAPDWLESEMRFASGLFKGLGIGPAKYEPDQKNFTRQQVFGTAAALWATARVLNLLYSGNAHYETPFGLATKDKDGKEVEFSVRTMPTDILHMATDPFGFLVGRESPLVRTGLEMYTGRNQYGQKLTDSEKYVDLVSNLVPIWGQAGLKQVTNLATSADIGTGAQIAKASGATAQVYRTPAEKTAANLASERSEEGSMNPARIQRHRLLLQLESDLRAGRISVDNLTDMVDKGNLPSADAKAVVKNVKETTGLDPETARMYSRTSRMDWPGAVAIYEDANPKEKEILQKLILKKAKAYIKNSLKNETPQGRAQDPMFAKAREMAGVAP